MNPLSRVAMRSILREGVGGDSYPQNKPRDFESKAKSPSSSEDVLKKIISGEREVSTYRDKRAISLEEAILEAKSRL